MENHTQETLLASGQLEVIGRIAGSWNRIFVARIDDGQQQTLAIYKPRAGEYPLWDFPTGTLCLREVAAFRISRALGWPAIPPTVLRDGPLGLGAVQQYIDADPQATYFSLRQDRLAELLPVALFDHLINNADRKGGHLLLDPDDRIWAIDHALTLHEEPKLRTVIWDWMGEPIPDPYLGDLRQLQEKMQAGQPLYQELVRLLSDVEIQALRERLSLLLESGAFPHPDPQRINLPWPLV